MKSRLLLIFSLPFILLGQYDAQPHKKIVLIDMNASFDNQFAYYKEVKSSEDRILLPDHTLYFSYFLLKNQHIETFKGEIIDLMKNHGYFYTFNDTIIQNRFYYINQLVYENNLQNWMIEQSLIYHPQWIQNNYFSYSVSNVIKQLKNKSEVINNNELINPNSWNQHFELIVKIVEIAKMNNNTLPNQLDLGISMGELDLLIEKALAFPSKINITWEFILPYIDKAYFEGKIGSNLYQIYDIYLYNHSGSQYYGFIPNAPYIEEYTLFKRKEKYDFVRENVNR